MHPIFTESGYINSVTTLLTDQSPPSNAVEGLLALLQLAWGVCLRRVSHLRLDLRRQQQHEVINELTNDSAVNEDILVTALESNAIEFLSAAVVNAANFCQEVRFDHQNSLNKDCC